MVKTTFKEKLKKKKLFGGFSGSLVVRAQCFHCREPSSISGEGTKIPQGVQLGKTNKTNFTIRIQITYQFKMLYLLPHPSLSSTTQF